MTTFGIAFYFSLIFLRPQLSLDALVDQCGLRKAGRHPKLRRHILVEKHKRDVIAAVLAVAAATEIDPLGPHHLGNRGGKDAGGVLLHLVEVAGADPGLALRRYQGYFQAFHGAHVALVLGGEGGVRSQLQGVAEILCFSLKDLGIK